MRRDDERRTARGAGKPTATTARRASGGRDPVIRPASTGPDTARVAIVDAARGFAVAMMIAYHFCFDLTFYRWAHWPMLDDARWIAWRSTIVGSFVFVVGVSLALRDDRDRRRGTTAWADRAFVRRWAQVAASALLVTIGSAALFPDTFIYFGVLHFVAVAVWLCRRAPRVPVAAIGLGIALVVCATTVSSAAFDPKWIGWIGFAAHKPVTEDYVPLVPWLGVVLVGCGVGGLWSRRAFALDPMVAAAWNGVPRPLCRLLAAMGRRSLTIYLLHQPILLGAMGLVKRLAP